MSGNRTGFSLVEVIIALMILSFGILAMGASTGFVMTQIRVSELRSERMAAVRQAAEIIRATPFNEVQNACGTTYTLARYTVRCQTTTVSTSLVRVHMVSNGPGYRNGQLDQSVEEAFALSIAQP